MILEEERPGGDPRYFCEIINGEWLSLDFLTVFSEIRSNRRNCLRQPLKPYFCMIGTNKLSPGTRGNYQKMRNAIMLACRPIHHLVSHARPVMCGPPCTSIFTLQPPRCPHRLLTASPISSSPWRSRHTYVRGFAKNRNTAKLRFLNLVVALAAISFVRT